MKLTQEELKLILGTLNHYWNELERRNDEKGCNLIDSLAERVEKER